MAITKRYQALPEASPPELLLLQKVAAGNQEAYRQLFDQYVNRLVYFLEPLCASSGVDHQDVIQDIFLQLWEKKETMTAIRSFDHYLFRMAKNRFLDLLRKETSTQQLYDRYGWLKKDGETLPEDQVQFEQYHEHAQAAIQLLSPKLKTVFILSTQEDHSLDQIAELLGLSKEAVKKRLWLAGNFIRKYLHEHTDIIFILILLPLLS